MIKLIDLLNEGKQVGILYHYTSPDNIEDIKKNGIKFSSPQQEISNMYYISTTRKKQKWKHQSQITLDGDKISEKYKISPIQASTFLDYDEEWLKVVGVKIDSLGGSELAEERILSKTPGYLSPEYILSIN
jgi:hypothetical protein